MLMYLAHAGVEHATEADASMHASANGYNWPVIIAMTLVVVFAALATIKLMDVATRPAPTKKETRK